MSTSPTSPLAPSAPPRLATLDRLLPVWIGLAMLAGLALGRLVPGVTDVLVALEIDGISLPILLGLLIMMYPPLAKVRYDRLGEIGRDRRLLWLSLVLNWVVGPALMFVLAWTFLPDLPEFRTGLIIVGLARCIAMVLIWNDLACGDREAGAFLVAINSVFQIGAYSLLGWFYLTALPGWLGWEQQALDVSLWDITRAVLVFLGLPLVAGVVTRLVGERRMGRQRYESELLPRIAPWALYGLLATVVLLFTLQGERITTQPFDVARIALPLLLYFLGMFAVSFWASLRAGLSYEKATTVAFTASGNNFELAIAVAIAVFGATSGQALAGVVGPLIEVPVLVGLVFVALRLRARGVGSSDRTAVPREGGPP